MLQTRRADSARIQDPADRGGRFNGILRTARLDLDQDSQTPLPERAVDKDAGVSDRGEPGFDGDALAQEQVAKLLGTGLGEVHRAKLGQDRPATDQRVAPGTVPDDPQSGRQPDR